MTPEATDKFLKEKVQDLKAQKRQDEIVGLIAALGEHISSEIKDGISNIKIDAPVIPEIKAPVIPPFPELPKFPEFPAFPEVKLPTINVPAPQVTVNVPDFPKIPPIVVPEPKVTVNVPKADAPIVNIPPFPESMSVSGSVGLDGVDKKHPLPVMMMGMDGKPLQMPGGSVGGGRGDFFTIKDIQTSSGLSIIDNDGFVRVTGSFSVAASNNSTQAIDSSGNPYSQANPFPVVFGSSGTTGTNIIDSTGVAYSGSNPLPITSGATLTVDQLSGVAWSTNVLTMPAVVVTSITNSIASNMVDSSGVAYSGSNPVPVVFSSSGSTATALIDSTGVQYSGSNPLPITGPVVVTSITNTTATNIVDSTGVAFEGANPFPITIVSGQLTTVGAYQLNGDGTYRDTTPISGSVSVTGNVTSTGAYLLNGDGTYRDTMPISGNIGTVTTLTGITNSTQIVNLDRDGNPRQPYNYDNGDSATALRVTIAGNGASASVAATQVGTWNIGTVTSVTNSIAATILDESGSPWQPFTFDNGDSATAIRVTVAGNSAASVSATQVGTWNINAVTSVTNSIAGAIVDSSGVQYSGSNPVPVSDTKLPTAAASADALANPTITQIGADAMLFNGTSWDRARGMSVATTTGDTGAKTVTGNGATQTNVGNKGIQVVLAMGAVTGTTPTFVMKMQNSVDGGTTWVDIPGATTASLVATGNWGISVYPGQAVTAGTTVSNTTATANGILARTWRVVWTIGGTTPSFTITSITYNYISN